MLLAPTASTCETQGTLFFRCGADYCAPRPRAFLLENVKNLVSHDKGRTFGVILRTLEREARLSCVHSKVLNAKGWVPQHRERIFIAGFRDDERVHLGQS